MTGTQHHGQWQAEPRQGIIHMKTNRIGIFTINAKAPVVGGEADWNAEEAVLTLNIGLNEVETGISLLDPEVKALVTKGSDGILRFKGTGHVRGDDVQFDGTAVAGDVIVPMSVTGEVSANGDDSREVKICGNATFEDIHLPLPGLSNIKRIDLTITGDFRLNRG